MTWGKNGTKIVLLVHAVMFSQTGHTEMIADNHHLSASEITNNEHLAQIEWPRMNKHLLCTTIMI